jgi:hypothetical protein
MKDARNQTERKTLLDVAIPLIEGQIISITILSPVVGMALNAAFWSTVVGIGFAAAMISRARTRIPQLIAVHARRAAPAIENTQPMPAYAA